MSRFSIRSTVFALVVLAGCASGEGLAVSISSFSPSQGTPSGGTPVTIYGANFLDGATVTFGRVPARVTFESTGSLSATAPAGLQGASVAVTVTNPNGASATSDGEYTYTTSILPGDSGQPPSVSVIVVTGDNDFSELNNACVIGTDRVWCWGDNSFGQLGDISETYSSVPIQVPTAMAEDIAGSGEHICTIVSGSVHCWGYNGYGELGNGTTNSSSAPVQAAGISGGATAVAAGQYHTCAVVYSSALCWGANYAGQLGSYTRVNNESLVPLEVNGLRGVTGIAAGNSTTCAVADGGAWCWGNNGNGQLGNGTTESSSVTLPVSFSTQRSGVTTVSVGDYHACAVVNGGAWCWGANNEGQLGNGTTTQSPLATQVSGLGSGVTAIAAGHFHTCAVMDGRVWCWGDNTYGELGNNVRNRSFVPVVVSGLTSGITAIAAGGLTSCAIASDSVWCWGSGALGSADVTDSSIPVLVSGL